MGKLTVTGMVMSAAPIGEYDRRVVILTRERGKISAFARGARRANSPLLAGTNPFAFGQFELFEGRDSYTVAQLHIQNYFRELTEDVEAAYYGFYFVEIGDYYGREYTDERAMLALIYQSLRALAKGTIPYPLIRRIFEVRAMAANGEFPDVHTLGAEGDVLYTLQFILTTPIQRLYTFRVSEQVYRQLAELVDAHLLKVMDRKFKSLEIIRGLPQNNDIMGTFPKPEKQ